MINRHPMTIHKNYDEEERARMEFLVYLIFFYIIAFTGIIFFSWWFS